MNLTELFGAGRSWAAAGESPGTTRGLNIRTPVYFGGVNREKYSVAPGVGMDADFSGCISGLAMGKVASGADGGMGNLAKFVVDSSNVRECPKEGVGGEGEKGCADQPCRNGGSCVQEQESDDGFSCRCKEGFR